jgi:DNA-directed RNA polymerase specialized sigma24 family protein
MMPDDDDDARRDNDQQRRDADSALYRRIVDAGFAGWEYERLRDDLVAYGIAVCEAWLLTGVMFRQCAERGRPVGSRPTDWSPEDRHELALETVANALKSFLHALEKGDWDPDAGASLRTYFIGRCVLVFPNVFRTWERERDRWDTTVLDDDVLAATPESGPSPEDQVVGREELREGLSALDTRTAIVVTLREYGYPQSEISGILGVTEGAVEALLHRHRRRLGGGRND